MIHDVTRDGEEIIIEEVFDGEHRVTRLEIGETPEGSEKKVVVRQQLAGEARPDLVGLTETRFREVRDLLDDADRDRAEFTEQFAHGDDVLDGTTTVETGTAAVVTQVIDDEPRSLGTVTLTRDHLMTVAVEFADPDNASAPEVEKA